MKNSKPVFSGLYNIFNAGKDFLLRIPNSVLYLLLFVSLLIIEYYNFHLCPDISIQLHTLKNFVNGHGITLTSIDENNVTVYQPCSLWPAGLVVFLSPIYLITKSAITTALAGKLMANLFFILFLSKYMVYLKLENQRKKVIIFFFIISVSPFIHFYPADTIATVLCLWGFYFNLKYQDDKKNINLAICVLLLSCSYFVKYSFLPFLMYPVAAFIVKERTKVFKQLRQLFTIISYTLAAAILIYAINYLLLGKSQMVSSFDALHGNAHWNQLVRTDGFLFNFGVVYEWAYENFIRNHFGIHIPFNWIAVFVTTIFYLMFLGAFLNKKFPDANAAFLNSINISLSAGALVFGFLLFLTINNPGQTWMKPYWTFVEETRYYGPVIVIGLVNVLIILLAKRKGWLSNVIIAGLFFINLFAYDFAIRSGFWGINAQTYFKIRKNIASSFNINDRSKISLVYFEPLSKASDEYYYLQSQGVILLEDSKYQSSNLNSDQFAPYFLKRDSTNAVKISSTR
ncbi:MAG: hypothetical protein ABIN67_12860 [Ferruginibacter sp.]